MSGFSEETECPNCGESCDIYTDWKPFNYSSMQCNHCGLLIGPKVEYMTLEELNEARAEANENNDEDDQLKMLEKLPEQTFQY